MQNQETRYSEIVDSELRDLWTAFESALAELGLAYELDPGLNTGQIEDVPVLIKLRAVPTRADVLAFARVRAPGRYKVLVSRRIAADTRTILKDDGIGFFDARGQLRIWRKPLLVDTAVPQVVSGNVRAHEPDFAVPSMMDVALAVLEGLLSDGVRAAAWAIGRSPGTVSKQLALMRRAHLVDEDGGPTIPDLFEQVLEEWRPRRLPLAGTPSIGAGALSDRLALGLEDVNGPGWVLSDAAAAAAWGAPIFVASDAPPDLYVPDEVAIQAARTLLGDAEFGHHACTVAAAPAPIVCRRRYDKGGMFPAPSSVVAALDLARDPARGREILDLWSRDLGPDLRRVW